RGDDEAAMTEHMKERVDAPDMIHEQEGQGPMGRALGNELLQKPAEIERRGLGLAGRAGAEQDQARSAAFNEGAQQRMRDRAVISLQLPLVVAVELNGVSGLGRLHHAL